MFQHCSVPFACPYRADLCCPVSVVVSERDPDRQCVAEAIPCHRCPHYLAQAQTLWAQRRVQLGVVGRQLLTLAREQGLQCYPLTATLRTHLPHQVDVPDGRHRAGWRKHQEALAAHFRTRYEQLATIDLFALYVEQVVAIVTAVTHQLVAATDAVMVARCAAPDSPYIGVFVHLDAVAPDACAHLQQVYLRVQDARQRAVSVCHAAVR